MKQGSLLLRDRLEKNTRHPETNTHIDSKPNTIEPESPCSNHHLVPTEYTNQNHVIEAFLLLD